MPAHPGAPEALEAGEDRGENRHADEKEGPPGEDGHDEPDESDEHAYEGDRDPQGRGPPPDREMEGAATSGMHVVFRTLAAPEVFCPTEKRPPRGGRRSAEMSSFYC